MLCGSDLVSFFVRFGVHQACMKSPLERNVRFCAIRLGQLSSDVGLYKWKKNCFVNNFVSYLSVGFMERACFVYEVMAIREGWLTLVTHNLCREEIDDIISYLVA